MPTRLIWGNVPVPYTASWSGEESFFLAPCPHACAVAICQPSAIGSGKPVFGKPHSCRQREVIARGLCGLCAKPLKMSTKVSLSHARPIAHSANAWEILQVEPMLHRRCALISIQNCPSLRRDIAAGTLRIRQVTQWRVQFAVMNEEYTEQVTGERRRSIGHAKVELQNWVDRDVSWLEGST